MSTTEAGLVASRLHELLSGVGPKTTDRDLRAQQYDLGLAWVHFPVGSGGLGVDAAFQAAVDDALHRAGRASPLPQNLIGIGLAAPTIAAHGTVDQQAQYLRAAFVLDEVWCQLFSEPGAGSDLAGLHTLARRDGDEWVVNGQKVWTSFAHKARRGVLLARTDPDVPKHQGLTCFALDMQSPGVEVRPLRQLTGDAEFNEVYLTDVRVPDAARIGSVGGGWRVGLTTLMNERSTLGGDALSMSAGSLLDPALRLWADHRPDEPALLSQLVDLWVEGEAHRLLHRKAAASPRHGQPGPEASIGKLVAAELNQRVSQWMMDVVDEQALDYPGYEPAYSVDSADPRWSFLRSRANTIEGGTTEVMLTILGERVLGLPGDVRVDKDVPWRAVPRS